MRKINDVIVSLIAIVAISIICATVGPWLSAKLPSQGNLLDKRTRSLFMGGVTLSEEYQVEIDRALLGAQSISTEEKPDVWP